MKTLFTLLLRRLLVSVVLGALLGCLYGAAIPVIVSAGAIIVTLYEYPRVHAGGGADPTTLYTVVDWAQESPFPPSFDLINQGVGYGIQAGAIIGLVNTWIEVFFLYFIHNREPGKLYGYLLSALGGYLIAINVYINTIDITNATSLQHYLYSTFFVLPIWLSVVVAILLLRANLLRHLRAYRRIALQAE